MIMEKNKFMEFIRKHFIMVDIFLIIVIIIIFIFIIFNYIFPIVPRFNHLINIKDIMTETQRKAIDIIIEATKFLIGLNTLIFGVMGFFISLGIKEKFQQNRIIRLVYFLICIPLGVSFYYIFLVYSQLLNELEQNSLALTPFNSYTLCYLERAVYSTGISAFLIFVLFVLLAYIKEGTKNNNE